MNIRTITHIDDTLKWRKNVKIGDYCYFYNMFGSKTKCKVVNTKDDKALIESKSLSAKTTQWIGVSALYPLNTL